MQMQILEQGWSHPGQGGGHARRLEHQLGVNLLKDWSAGCPRVVNARRFRQDTPHGSEVRGPTHGLTPLECCISDVLHRM
jgi:hypothetical protein